MDFNESRTYENLQKAMDCEMRSSMRYSMYAQDAQREKLRPIAQVFNGLSDNEKAHAEIWKRLITDNRNETTAQNLKDAAAEEQRQWMKMYEEYANIAAEEGYNEISNLFRRVALIEHHHDILLTELRKALKTDCLFCSEEETIWVCTNCGYLYYGKCAPDKCPVCGYPKEYYDKLNEENDNYEN